MAILTEPIGSIPRPASLIQAIRESQAGQAPHTTLDAAYEEALRDTVERFGRTGSPVITDGEQTKPSFATYPLAGLTNLAFARTDARVIELFARGYRNPCFEKLAAVAGCRYTALAHEDDRDAASGELNIRVDAAEVARALRD